MKYNACLDSNPRPSKPEPLPQLYNWYKQKKKNCTMVQNPSTATPTHTWPLLFWNWFLWVFLRLSKLSSVPHHFSTRFIPYSWQKFKTAQMCQSEGSLLGTPPHLLLLSSSIYHWKPHTNNLLTHSGKQSKNSQKPQSYKKVQTLTYLLGTWAVDTRNFPEKPEVFRT